MKTTTQKTDELLEQLLYLDFRTEKDIDRAKTLINQTLIRQELDIKEHKQDQIKYLELLIFKATERLSMPVEKIRGDGFQELMAFLRDVAE